MRISDWSSDVCSSDLKVEEQEKERLRLQVLRNLIDETLQIQEAKANDIVVDRAEIDQSYARVAQNFGQNPQQFDTYLRDQGSSAASMKRQIEGELAWGRLLRDRKSVVWGKSVSVRVDLGGR